MTPEHQKEISENDTGNCPPMTDPQLHNVPSEEDFVDRIIIEWGDIPALVREGAKQGWPHSADAKLCDARAAVRAVLALLPRPSPTGEASIQEIKHSHQPQTARQEREDLERRIANDGPSVVVGILQTWALMQPSEGSFAGMLWALSEWVHCQIALPSRPTGEGEENKGEYGPLAKQAMATFSKVRDALAKSDAPVQHKQAIAGEPSPVPEKIAEANKLAEFINTGEGVRVAWKDFDASTKYSRLKKEECELIVEALRALPSPPIEGWRLVREALSEIETENNRARKQFTNVSNNLIRKAIAKARSAMGDKQ